MHDIEVKPDHLLNFIDDSESMKNDTAVKGQHDILIEVLEAFRDNKFNNTSNIE